MNEIFSRKLILGASLSFFILYALFLIPSFQSVINGKSDGIHLLMQADGLLKPLIRSIISTIIILVLLIAGGIICSLNLYSITIDSIQGKLLSLLLLPSLLGGISSALIYKIILVEHSLYFETVTNKFISYSIIHYWQFGTLFIYLFWLNGTSLKSNFLKFSDSMKFSFREFIRDIWMPKQKNLIILLSIIGFVFTFYEEAKSSFIFRVSRGTNSEFINQFINRTYKSESIINSELAFTNLCVNGFVALVFALMTLALVLFLVNKLVNFRTKKRNVNKRSNSNISKSITQATFYLLLIFVLFPIVYVLTIEGAKIDDLEYLLSPITSTAIAAVVSTIIAITTSIVNRLLLPGMLSDFNDKSLIYFVLLFSLLLVPPVLILIITYKWFSFFQVNYNAIPIAWVIGHFFMCFPILSGFATTSHFKVKNNFILFLDVHKASITEKIKQLFLRPLFGDYILTFLFAFTIIWNEAIINNILSDVIPSFVSEMNMSITGKIADYSKGIGFLLISLIISLLSILIWSFGISKTKKI